MYIQSHIRITNNYKSNTTILSDEKISDVECECWLVSQKSE